MFGKIESKYAFRERLTETYKKGICLKQRNVTEGEISLFGGVRFCVHDFQCSEVLKNALLDFSGFLSICGGLETVETEGGIVVEICNEVSTLGEYASYKGRIVTISEGQIKINAFDERGAAAALYDLEDLMIRAEGLVLEKRQLKNKPKFSPRMVHSAYDLDVFPDEYLLNLVKEGIDAILIFIRNINENPLGKMDTNDIIRRANALGLDVYAYCQLTNFHHPNEENAEEIFYNVYGKFFEAHNGFKGLVLVGESVEFPSEDEHVAKRHYYELPEDGIPDSKVSPGWWPCRDYPEWLNLIKKSVRKVKPEADIVFWTYNWGYAPEEDRIRLLKNLPTDISLLVTFEMFEKFDYNGVTEMVCDYSIARPDAGKYFLSEAKVAKERGIRLYSMANTGGRTWDSGILPYFPVAQTWLERFIAVNKAQEEYGLSGLMECHHYGYTPSFFTKFAKFCFEEAGDYTGSKSYQSYLNTALADVYGKDWEAVKKAFQLLSDGMKDYPPTDEMQYGPMRIGTAYPLILINSLQPKQEEKTMFGLLICETVYRGLENPRLSFTLHSVRNRVEINGLKKFIKKTEESIVLLRKENLAEEALRLLNIICYLRCMLKTSVNVKQFFELKNRLLIAHTNASVKRIIARIEKLGAAEIENARESIQYVRKDSALGYEVSMGYQADERHIEWKIRQVEYMLQSELEMFRKGVRY